MNGSPPWPLLPRGCQAAKSRTAVAARVISRGGEGHTCPERTIPREAPVAQLDRALDYESRGREFESLRARQISTEAE
jgi:hypothetical protein